MFPADLPTLLVRPYEPADEAGVLAAMARAYGRAPTPAEWRWEMQGNPSGAFAWLALDETARVVGLVAARGARMLFEGEPVLFALVVSALADPQRRRGLRNPGVHVRTLQAFAEAVGGPAPERVPIVWGMPVPETWRIANKLLKLEAVRTQLVLSTPLARLVLAAAPGVEVEEVQHFPDAVDGLFARCAAGRGALAVRDRAQLAWRFGARPGVSYAQALARRGTELVGAAVFRPGDLDGERGVGLVCDWLVLRDDAGATSALLAWLAARARDAGVETLHAFAPETAPEWRDFQSSGFHARRLRKNYFLAARSFQKRTSMRWLYDNWYYTLGDTHVV
ncbi:MAG: hypothetical protein HOP15_15525 [Planctomycetes bacterium]|nr:hypothetical protein [Planctomycetota bacterium]